MAQYTDFKLYWEMWGGYPDRSVPFGEPNLTWIISANKQAACCTVGSEPKGSMDVAWHANWQSIPYSLIEPLPALLAEAGAFGEEVPLVEDAVIGDYLVVWDLTGVVQDRPFHLSLKYTCPGEKWTPLGQRLRDALLAVKRHAVPQS